MNAPDGAANPTASTNDRTNATENTPKTDPEFALIAWYAQLFQRPFSPDAVTIRLPESADMQNPAMIARALAAIGLKSRLVLRDPKAIDQIVLPCIVFPKSGGPQILVSIGPKGKTASVVDPSEGDLEQDVRMRQLRREIRPEILLVTLADDRANSRLSPEAAETATSKGHWFWRPVLANWANWIQILIAALILNILSLALPLFVMNVYDKVIPNLAFVTLWTLALGVAIALGFDLILRTMRANILENIGRRVDLKVASTIFAQAMNVQLLTRPGGAAGIANTIRDFEVVREFFASATFVAIIDILFIGVFVAVLFAIVGPIAVVPLIAVPIVVVMALIAQIPIGRSAAKAQQMATKRHIVLIETLMGIETIKSLNAEPVMQAEWENAVTASSRINGRTKFWSNVASNGTMLVQQAVSIIIIVWGVFLVSKGQITIGGLIAANILAGRVLAPLGTIAQTIFRAQYAFKSLAALNRFMRLPVEHDASITSNLRVTNGTVQIKSVTFTYPDAQTPALRDLSMDLRAGQIVALLGKVGSGKTTTGKLITGLLQPQEGTVLVDGIALSQYEPAELRSGIGYLPQNPELFTGTLRENILIGAGNATDKEIQQALYYAAMDAFVAGVPEGLDLFIGEQGNRLSGGQRQGLALARLLIRKPRLLFLDEPTNAMDQSMETDVITRLKELNRAGTGLVVCTHRQSLAAIADRLLVMDQGRIVLDGPRAEVLTRLRALGSRDAQGTQGTQGTTKAGG
jgi:ATP-binding cassette subfamily C protein LapB